MSEQDDSRKQNKDNGADALSTDYAVALGYDHTKQAAPKVLAKGQGPIAQKIVQIAIDEGIEIRRDADLVQILKAVDIDEEIPVEAFAAVAEIISYVYQVNNNSCPKPKPFFPAPLQKSRPYSSSTAKSAETCRLFPDTALPAGFATTASNQYVSPADCAP